jgi:hypothetical protein
MNSGGYKRQIFKQFLKFIGVEERSRSDDEVEFEEEQVPATNNPQRMQRASERVPLRARRPVRPAGPDSPLSGSIAVPKPLQPQRPSAQQDPGYAKIKEAKSCSNLPTTQRQAPNNHIPISEHTETKAGSTTFSRAIGALN